MNQPLIVADIQTDISSLLPAWQIQANALIEEVNKAISQIPEVAQNEVEVTIQVGFIPVPIFQAEVKINK